MKKKLTSVLAAAALAVNMVPVVPFTQTVVHAASTQRAMENLGRGLVVIKNGTSMYLSWRLLGTESYDTTFNVYRDGYLIANVSDSTNYSDIKGNSESEYQIAPVANGVEGEKCAVAKQWDSDTNYIEFDIPVPTGGDGGTLIHDGEEYTYSINDMSTGDLDGDGEYELVVKFMPSNAGESTGGHTGNVMLGAYELDGTPLWTDNGGNTLYIDLGLNIRANPHGPQFLVYDFNSDGIAEISTKTAQGTMDTQGNVLVESSSGPDYYTVGKVSDYTTDTLYNKSTSNSFSRVNSAGTVLHGREYYTMYSGYTGAFIDTVAYHTPRTFAQYTENSENNQYELTFLWGDNWGNRVDRHSDTVAYLDGETPYAVEWRGYYHGTTNSKQPQYNGSNLGRTAVGAYKLVGNDLQCAYTFDTAGEVKEKYDAGTLSWDDIFSSRDNALLQLITNNPDWNYCGNGNHNMVAADFDEDGMDEVASGSLCLQLKNGEFGVKWNYNRGHGDAFSLGRYVKDGPLLYFLVHEDGRGESETVNSSDTTTETTEAVNETGTAADTTTATTTTETIISRPDNDTIIWEVVTVVTTVETTEETITTTVATTTSNVTRTYSSDTISAIGRGHGMSVIDPREDGEINSSLDNTIGEPEVLFFEDAGGDTGRGIMIKGTEDSFLVHSSGNTARTVTYDADTADDTDDSDGTVSKNGYTFTKGGGIGINKNGGASYNSCIYWDGDVYEEALDGFTSGSDPEYVVMGNYNESTGYWDRITVNGTWTNNSTKNNVCLSADLIGDWREEFICRVADTDSTVRLYTTNIQTDKKIYTLMHDSQYRSGVASEQAAYNQPPHVSWYMGADMDMEADKPDITTVDNDISNEAIFTPPERTYSEAAATLLWQDIAEYTGTSKTHTLTEAYTGENLGVHVMIKPEGSTSLNLLSDASSYNIASAIWFNAEGVVSLGKDQSSNYASGTYTPGQWHNVDYTLDTTNHLQSVTVANAETGVIVFAYENAGFRQSTGNIKKIAVSNSNSSTVAVKNCAVYTGTAPTTGTVTADKTTVRAGTTLDASSISWKTTGGTAPASWVTAGNTAYTLYKDNLYTEVDVELEIESGVITIPRTVSVGDYVIEVYDNVDGYSYLPINIAAADPIKVSDSDVVLEINGLSGTSIAGTVYSDTDLIQAVSKSELGIERKSRVLSVLAKISDSTSADPVFTVESYEVTISQNGEELEKVTPTNFAGNNGICMSQFVDGVIQPGEYSVTVEMTINQDGDIYTVSKTGSVTIKEAANIEEYFYTINGINVTVFVK